jgi:hypothetical protein
MASKPTSPSDNNQKSVTPPYEGRRKAGKVKRSADGSKGSENTGGASGPVADDDMKAPDPSRTPGGATGSPADRNATRSPTDGPSGDDPEDHGTGPAHHRGTRRGEDQS